MSHETANLMLDDDGDVYVFVPCGEEERDIERLGHIESGPHIIPDHLLDEYEELVDVWREWDREANGYYAGVDLAWRTAKGC
jgi:hypothetical protein